LGGAAVFDVLNRLRPGEEAAPNHPNPPWCPRSSVCAHVMLGSSNTIPCGPDRFSAHLLFPSESLARRLLFFPGRRRRFVLGTRRALMDRLRRPLTLCSSLMMSGRRGRPALRMRRSRMRRGSRPRFRRSRTCVLSCCGSGWCGFSAGRMRRGSGPGFCGPRGCMLGRCGSGRLGRTWMSCGSGFGLRMSRIRVCGRRGSG
jgi:hypothetical protein